jgi:hypothetical protein
MSPTLLFGVLGLVVGSASVVWLILKSNRAPVDDHVTASVLTRINTEYRENP